MNFFWHSAKLLIQHECFLLEQNQHHQQGNRLAINPDEDMRNDGYLLSKLVNGEELEKAEGGMKT